MYEFNYQYRLKSGTAHNAKYEHTTVLTATFLFGQEITPLERKEVKERCRTSHRSVNKTLLNNYLFEKEGACFEYADRLFGRAYYTRKSTFTITPLPFRLGFKLRQEVSGHLPLEEMINLSALDRFVRTGENPNQEQKTEPQEQKQTA
ncbi:MAG: hypothetical protein AABX54_01115 [Nanoarchaeota archaeon]